MLHEKSILNTIATINNFNTQNQTSQALELCSELVELHPNDPRSWTTLGVSLYLSRRFEESITAWENAIHLDPDNPHFYYHNISQSLLMTGELRKGFELYQSRINLYLNFYPEKKMWKGENISGKTLLILHDDGGLGDSIMYLRYIQFLKKLNCKVFINLQPELHCLFQYLEIPILNLPNGSLFPCDYYAFLGSLPYYFGTDLSNIPPPITIRATRRPVSGRVGIVWRASIDTPKQTGMLSPRSINLAQLIPLLAVPGMHFVCAQKEVSGEEAELLDRYGVERPMIKTFTDTVEILEDCERVICVDTSITHLSASMGIATWVLIHYDACWKWLIYRIDSPWYPSIRLFRQSMKNIWDDPIQAIKQNINKQSEAKEG